jgi:hypothetical protein
MRLRVFEAGLDGSSSLITIGDRPINMKHIRVHIYKHLAPTGTMRLLLADRNSVVTLAYADVLLSSLPSANYYHGMVKFDLSYPLQANTSYYLILSSAGGYSYSGSAFFGWAWAEGMNGFEVWEEKLLIRGA